MKLKTPNSKLQRGFNLVELLVVIAVICILAALLLPALSMAKERAVRTKCLSNVRQITIASLNYALDNRDRLPLMNTTPPAIPNFISAAAVTEFLPRYCPMRDAFYDPGFPALNQDANWNATFFPAPGLRLIGYAVTFPTPGTTLKPENINTWSAPQPGNAGASNVPAPIASDRVLVAGLVMSYPGQDKTNPSIQALYTYRNIKFDGVDDKDIGEPYMSTAHMRRILPTGENLGMLDGSARWRKFREMIPRTGLITYWW